MKIAEVRDKLEKAHAAHPGRSALANRALDEIQDGLNRLAALGSQFELTDQIEAGKIQHYPKMYYKDGQEPLIVNSYDELPDKGLGWRETPIAQPE